MTVDPPSPAAASGQACVTAIRAILTTFPGADGAPGEPDEGFDVWSFVQDADPMTVYQLVALSAATIRWASTELGRSELEILEELAANFERGSEPEQDHP